MSCTADFCHSPSRYLISRAELGGRTYFDVTGGRFNPEPYLRASGATRTDGYQLRYIYFLDPTARERLTVPILPYDEIDRRGAGMYRGKPRAGSVDGDTSAFHVEEGGSIPTPALHDQAAD